MGDWSKVDGSRRVVHPQDVDLRPTPSPRGTPTEPKRVQLFVPSGGDERAARDVAIFNRMVDGTVAVADGMKAIAHSSGFPLRTNNGYVFAHVADGVDAVHVIGDHTGWNDRPQAMKRNGALFWAEVPVDSKAAQPRYKLQVTRDSQTTDIADPTARHYGYDDQGFEMSFVRASGPHAQRFVGVSDGNVETTLRVWLPKGPVKQILYGHDGQNLFNPCAPHGGWRLNDAVGPNTMIVGIDHPPDRMGCYTHPTGGGNGAPYAAFSNDTVVDFIEARFKKPKVRGLLGSSLGACMVYQQLEQAPGKFDLYALLSGTFGWGEPETLIDRARQLDLHGTRPVLVFYSGGDHGVNGPGRPETANDNYEETLEMARVFHDVHGYEWDRDLFHAHAAGRPHGEIPWAEFLSRQQPVKNPIGMLESLG